MSHPRLISFIHFPFTLRKGVFAPLLALVLLTFLSSRVQHALAAPMGTITVNTASDNTTTDGLCSLREAITNANDDAATHLDCAAGSGADTINFSGVTLINIATELAITSDITFNGTGITVDNTGTGRVFLITSATVIINGMTITGGDSAGVGGGGIRISGGSLTLQSGAVVTGNTAGGAGGGGVYALSNAQVTITGSGTQITGNTDSGNGAGLNLQAGADAFLLDGAVISNNSGPNSGGGVSIAGTGSSFTVDNATVSANSAQFAGGIVAFSGGTLILQNGAVISGNSATVGTGGGVTISSGAGGLSVSDTRFEGNTAVTNGDAIYYLIAPNATITNSCFTNNGDTAITNLNTGLITAHGNWWGSTWGPQIVAAGGGSAISNGDSISGNGVTGVDVGLTSAGAADGSSIPSGNWLTTAPSTCDTVLPTVAITPAAFNVNEGNNADFTLTRTGSTTSTLVVSVDITLGGGTDTADYTLSGGTISGQSGNQTVTIPAGQASVNVNFAAATDGDAEADNNVTMTLVDGVAYNLGAATASTATIPANTITAVTLTSLGATPLLTAGGWVVWVGAMLLLLLASAFAWRRQWLYRGHP